MINPSFCILFYPETTNLSENLKYYLELGKFQGNELVSLTPLSNDDIRNMSKILNSEAKEVKPFFNFINKHILFKNETYIFWYADNVPEQLYYIDGKKTFSKKIKLPKIMFGYNYSLNNFFVYFLIKEDGLNSTFYKPNLPNYGSVICIGKNKILGNNEYGIMCSVEDIFFKSPFTSKIKNINLWKKNEITLKSILGLK